MQADDLIRMANQIAMFFAPYDEAEAVEGVRNHVISFWDPAMRRELLAIGASASQSAQLHPLVVRAIAQLATPTPT